MVLSYHVSQDEKSYMKENIRGNSVLGTSASLKKASPLRVTKSAAQRVIVAKICEEGKTLL